MNRRHFLLQTGAATGALLVGRARAVERLAFDGGGRVAIICDPDDGVASSLPVQWAVGELRDALKRRSLQTRDCRQLGELTAGEWGVVVAGPASPLLRAAHLVAPTAPESLIIAPGRVEGHELACAVGADARGLVYALTDMADALDLGEEVEGVLRPRETVSERPANPVRSVMRLFASDVEDKPWYNDRDFWRSYLSMLARLRFNRFNLALGLGYDQPIGLRDTYFYFAYPFLVAVPGYTVRASHLPDGERDRNLAMLRFISDEAARRGLDFQLGLWTHAYQWSKSPEANHVIEGLTPELHAPYCRDALALVLKECPNITGVTVRIHGESGVPEGSYDLWRTIFDGCVRSGRRVGLDLHAKGMDQSTLDAAQSTRLPITLSPKFWAEHMGLPYHQACIRPTELPTGKPGRGPFTQSEGARSFLRYGYGDLLREDRNYTVVHRLWPGTQRVLLWADPVFAAAYSRASTFCGTNGCEIFDPLSFKGRKGSGLPGGREGYADLALRPSGGDFEKFRHTYRIWGRLLFNPATSPATLERDLRADHGPAAAPAVAAALAQASRVLPLLTTAHLPSAANNNFWPEMYVNMSLVDSPMPAIPYSDTPLPRRFGTVSPLDPELFSSVEQFANEALAGKLSGRYSPLEVAEWMEEFASGAESSLALAAPQLRESPGPGFRRIQIDVTAVIHLGRFFAKKLRAGVAFALAEKAGNESARQAALESYRAARIEWTRLIDVTKSIYRDDVSYGEGWFQRGHWSDRLEAIDRDIVAVEKKQLAAAPAGSDAELIHARLREAQARQPSRLNGVVHHTPAASFVRGEAVALAVSLPEARSGQSVSLFFRHTHQAEPWEQTALTEKEGRHVGSIPAAYTDSPYPLQYFFQINDRDAWPWIYPGLGPHLTQQPYLVLRSA